MIILFTNSHMKNIKPGSEAIQVCARTQVSDFQINYTENIILMQRWAWARHLHGAFFHKIPYCTFPDIIPCHNLLYSSLFAELTQHAKIWLAHFTGCPEFTLIDAIVPMKFIIFPSYCTNWNDSLNGPVHAV